MQTIHLHVCRMAARVRRSVPSVERRNLFQGRALTRHPQEEADPEKDSVPEEKTGPDATPRIGLNLGRQVLDEPGSGAHQEERSGDREERIRRRAYEIWEQEGRSGNPHDHWTRAEREAGATAQDPSDATV